MMFELVKGLLAKQLRIPADQITLESKIKDDLGADSISVLQLLMTIEEDHGIIIPEEDVDELVTVADVVAEFEKLTK